MSGFAYLCKHPWWSHLTTVLRESQKHSSLIHASIHSLVNWGVCGIKCHLPKDTLRPCSGCDKNSRLSGQMANAITTVRSRPTFNQSWRETKRVQSPIVHNTYFILLLTIAQLISSFHNWSIYDLIAFRKGMDVLKWQKLH